MKVTCKKLNPHIQRWIDIVEHDEIKCCKEQKQLIKLIKKSFETEEVYTDDEQLEKYLSLSKYLKYDVVFEWEAFCIALHDCTYWRNTGEPRWPFFFGMMGRGSGKDGFIALDSLCMISPYNGIRSYDVDICANNEEQAMRPLNDLLEAFEMDPKTCKKLKRFFRWNKTLMQCIRLKGMIKGRTNNPKGRDGMRSGKVVFNEVHQYENYDNINVFVTGLGKKPHPRRTIVTTNGDVREGPLDDYLSDAEAILKGAEPDNGMLPFICRLDDVEEVHDPDNWTKAIPSLKHLPHLFGEIKLEYITWKKNPASLPAFMTKRFNRPSGRNDLQITEWKNIEATKRELPVLEGWICIAGIDYATLNDWAAVNLHFVRGEERFDINHAWICSNSNDLPRIKAPWRTWVDESEIEVTLVDDLEINPDLISGYIEEAMHKYYVKKVALDNHRYALLKRSLERIGFSGKDKLVLIRPSDIMRIAPVIISCFNRQLFTWGNSPHLRWAANNTKLVKSGKKEGTDTGNYYFAKIESKSRKTDPFMALVASMICEDDLGNGGVLEVPDEGPVGY